MRYAVLSLYALVVVAHLYTCVRTGKHTLRKLTKCLLMPLLALCYRLFAVDFSLCVFLALIFGFFGDAFLLAPKWNWSFGAGLGSFAVGHVLYIVHMLGALPALPAWYIFAAIGALCGGMAAYAVRSLWDGLPKSLRAPCSFYAFDITLMACCAFLFALAMPRAVAWLAPLGGVLFVASDTTLSVDAFKRPVPHRYLIVMGTYIAAQTMLTVAFALD